MRKTCTSAQYAEKKYGRDIAAKLYRRLFEIRAAESIEYMERYHIGGCHSLSLNRKGQYAVSLVHPFRLIFEVKGEEIQVANIIEIVDYH